MLNDQPRGINSLTARLKKRRPEGVSRRQRKQFSFETLEDRRYMTGVPVLSIPQPVNTSDVITGSISSATPEGAAQTILREQYWQALIAASLGQGGTTSSTGAASGAMFLPNDPLFPQQWHLANVGQEVGNPDYQSILGKPGEDVHVVPVWNQGITGTGVRVGVFDTGVQLDHPDLIGNIDLSSAFDAQNPSGTGNPIFVNNPAGFHGTAVAGIIGAMANNGIGGSGIAPGVTLVPVRLIDQDPTPSDFIIDDPLLNAPFIQAFNYAIRNGIDITNNSWGINPNPFDPMRTLSAFSPSVLNAIRDTVLFGRNGLGIINVFASGNSGGPTFHEGFTDIGTFDTSSYGITNTRYIITVGGVDHDGSYNNVDGTVTNYSEAGANLLVVGPTGSFARINIADDTGIGSGIVTTDLTGDLGANAGVDPLTGIDPDRDFLEDTDYTSRMNGTSAAAPMVSGVIALMLQANPNLSWRDVQEILVRSARQNDPFSAPGVGSGLSTQSSWIVNQVPLFHDPDRYIPGLPIPGEMYTLRPIANPNAFQFRQNTLLVLANNVGSDHYVSDPFRLTTGAGYTVSQGTGRYGEMMGYGHGEVDADLAVKLAQQWTTKNQTLAPELTFTTFVAKREQNWTLPAAVRSSDASLNQIIPGGIGGQGGFVEWWEEYFDPNPDFSDFDSYRGDEYVEFTLPDSQAMSIESVDVRLNIVGDAAEALEHVRIALVSPEGTISDLNHYVPDGNPITTRPNQTFQWEAVAGSPDPLTKAHPYIGSFGTTDPGTGQLVYTFNTNRNWGERGEDRIVFDPATGEPVVDVSGQLNGTTDVLGRITPAVPGQAMKQGWKLVIENWDRDTSFQVSDMELAWHGKPVPQNSQRILGFVGIDENGDDNFNYSRVVQSTIDLDGDPNTLRLGELVSTPDLSQESFAANQTVTVRRTSDNHVVSQFVTGHDGNFYFDLVPDDYIISIEDPQGRAAKDDTVTPDQYLSHYKHEWHITPEWFKVWDHANGSPNEVVVDQDGNPVPWVDGNGNQVTYGMTGINFLLDPGDIQHSTFTGTVYADANGDGAFNNSDVALPGITVFGDVNANGVLDEGETTAVSDANGQYVLAIDTAEPLVMKVGVVPPAQWTVTNPSAGSYALLAQPGVQTPNLDFYLKPASNNAGGGDPNATGILLGSIYIDANGNGSRDAFEQGAAGVQVFLDDNGDGLQDGDEQIVSANQLGAYVFTDVEAGEHTVRLVAPGATFQQTQPAFGASYVVNLTAGSVISGLAFGIRDAAIYDFGDLPAKYHATTLADNGARHVRGLYFLGAGMDGELDGVPSDDAMGDDALGPDEDGVSVLPLNSGGTATITVTASRYNGYLQAWFDWNDDGDFNDFNERVITNRLLDQGANSITFAVPSGVTATEVFARFRYGEFGINSPFGAALTGEVEDYAFPIIPQAPPVVGMPADFNQDGVIDGFDFLMWQRNHGTPTGATQTEGSADSDGDVDRQDMIQWYLHYGESQTLAALTADSSAAQATETSGVQTASVTAEFTQGGSAPLAALSYSSVSSPAMRPSYRPPDQSVSSDGVSVASVLADDAAISATDKDAALDDLFQSDDLVEAPVDSATGVEDGDEAFALLASSL